jgi:hypothetical protein
MSGLNGGGDRDRISLIGVSAVLSRAAEYMTIAVVLVLIASARTGNHRHTVSYDLHLSFADALYRRRARDGRGSQWPGDRIAANRLDRGSGLAVKCQFSLEVR